MSRKVLGTTCECGRYCTKSLPSDKLSEVNFVCDRCQIVWIAFSYPLDAEVEPQTTNWSRSKLESFK